MSNVLEDRSGRLRTDQYYFKNMPGLNSLGTVPDVRIIQYWSQEEVKQDNHSEYIARYVEGRCEWLSCIIDLCPIQADGE